MPELFTLVPHTILQSFHRSYDVPQALRWRPGHFAAHVTGMPIEERLLWLQQAREAIGEGALAAADGRAEPVAGADEEARGAERYRPLSSP